MRTRILAVAASGMAVFAPSATAFAHPEHQAQDQQRTVLVVLAHPDDELVFAPAIAAEARAGSDVRFVYATSGDAGPGVSDLEPGAQLATARELEARCSADALGVKQVDFLRLGDGTLTKKPRSQNSPAHAALPLMESAILAAKPDVVITWGPDGGYGHGDHRMVSVLVTQILQQRSADERPELLYPALVHAPLPDILQAQGWATTAPDLASVRYSYSDSDLAAANAATQCHATQFDKATRDALTPVFHAAVWKGDVAFRPAF